MESQIEARINYEKKSANSKWENYDFACFYQGYEIEEILKKRFKSSDKSSWYYFFYEFFDVVSREFLSFFNTYILMLSDSELLNLRIFFKKSSKYFIAERKYLIETVKKYDESKMDSLNFKLLLMLMKFFKFSLCFFKQIAVFLKYSKVIFLNTDDFCLFLGIIRMLFKDLIAHFEDWPCPSNFRGILRNLNKCYFKVYECVVKEDFNFPDFETFMSILKDLTISSLRNLGYRGGNIASTSIQR